MGHQLLLKLEIVAWYEYNKTYVAKNLCENRDRPALKCSGKCYLNKQLAKADAEKKSGRPLDPNLDKREISVFILPSAIKYPKAIAVAGRRYFERPQPFAADVWRSVEHPPG